MSNNFYVHKATGPSLRWAKESSGWMMQNKWHRYYGPAVEGPLVIWYVHGKKVKQNGE